MATFRRFEDIKAWKKARHVTKNVYRVSRQGEFRKDFALRKQIESASVSIMANIAEGHGRRTAREFANHLNIARGSSHEVQSLLYVAGDLEYIRETEFRAIYAELAEISKMLLSLARYLRSVK
ncbi:MAG: four helix bundle protein [Pyrinomonadaceae bacterium]|nr:four helix bundle protein [Pyrinomonadaceae bacterium]